MLKSAVLLSIIGGVVPVSSSAQDGKTDIEYANMPEVLPETNLLTWEGDLSAKMMDGAHEFIEPDENIQVSPQTSQLALKEKIKIL